ncbi:AAA family ATPase [Anaeromassilibacillus sp. An200]|uniref:AAA family ATPase n=1 Tax=Anaeromassilibacillus sp. An200 TaxID=1965587 RepID=UPI000B3A6C94|nr:AAA family ATPase [Anaeromassilibacillus sp. An200]OUP13894.1 hypothetical protein B5F35_02715 [Anaeromassilibacillus sp. An200]
MTPTRKQQLFLISGASCVGKSTLCEELFHRETAYIVLESDLIWREVYDTPEDNYRAFRQVWMRICSNVSQIGLPVVLCGCAIPEQFEALPERALFTETHYLAAVCNDAEMRRRICEGRGVTDEKWIRSSLDFNRWLRENAGQTTPKITLLDTTSLTPQQAAVLADRWITERLKP